MQLAKLAGCTVVATCSSADKAALLRRLGADRVVDYKAESLKVGAVVVLCCCWDRDCLLHGAPGLCTRLGLARRLRRRAAVHCGSVAEPAGC